MFVSGRWPTGPGSLRSFPPGSGPTAGDGECPLCVSVAAANGGNDARCCCCWYRRVAPGRWTSSRSSSLLCLRGIFVWGEVYLFVCFPCKLNYRCNDKSPWIVPGELPLYLKKQNKNQNKQKRKHWNWVHLLWLFFNLIDELNGGIYM